MKKATWNTLSLAGWAVNLIIKNSPKGEAFFDKPGDVPKAINKGKSGLAKFHGNHWEEVLVSGQTVQLKHNGKRAPLSVFNENTLAYGTPAALKATVTPQGFYQMPAKVSSSATTGSSSKSKAAKKKVAKKKAKVVRRKKNKTTTEAAA